MMLKRKAMDALIAWKNNPARKSLIIDGARQVGKTFLVRRFAREHYDILIELNFLENASLKTVFSGSLDAETIITSLNLILPEYRILPGKTLLFLDEAQECPNAITSLKFLTQDNRMDVIASGSALGLAYRQVSSFPVGYVEYLDMASLDFEEFLWGMNVSPESISFVKKCFETKAPVPPAIHEKMMDYLRQYLVIGGMPEAVQLFTQTHDYYATDALLRNIYRSYISDIAHYATPELKVKAEKCYRSIPLQLSKENHKFQYKTVERNGTARKFETSIDWLVNAHIASPVPNVSNVELPLKAYAKEDNFRLYMTDIGLLVSTYGYDIKKAILEDRTIETVSENLVLRIAKGGLYEALAADLLLKRGYAPHFFRNDSSTVEIEFLIENKDGVIPIEIKVGRKRSTSLDQVLKQPNILYGYKLSSQNVGVSEKKITLPLYMLMFL